MNEITRYLERPLNRHVPVIDGGFPSRRKIQNIPMSAFLEPEHVNHGRDCNAESRARRQKNSATGMR